MIGNGGCSHFCLPRADGERTCACMYNVKLLSDNKTCDGKQARNIKQDMYSSFVYAIYFFLKDRTIFDSGLRPFQDYFSSYETGQSVSGSKSRKPREFK